MSYNFIKEWRFLHSNVMPEVNAIAITRNSHKTFLKQVYLVKNIFPSIKNKRDHVGFENFVRANVQISSFN